MDRFILDRLSPGVSGPSYPREQVTTGIAHIGVGAFHRAHLAAYIERCLADTDQRGWGLLGINLLPRDITLSKALRAQDNLYSLTELAPDGTHATRVIGAMIEHRYAPDDPAALLMRLCDSAIRIVSLTITEGGYLLDADGRFRLEDPSVTHDLAHPEAPCSAFGFIVGSLRMRRDAGIAPFTVMSCDNLRHNGDQARRACLGFANAVSPRLAAWIEAEVDFPNAMVDRITPAMSAERRAWIHAQTGLDDAVPVACEDFSQWVLEDRFRNGRPAWERHSVQMVDDVTAYEDAKIRLLNGAHEMLSFPAWRMGYRQVDTAMQDPFLHGYLHGFLEQDACFGLVSRPGLDLPDYIRRLLERFGNPSISDQIERLCMDGGSKIPGFLRPTLDACMAAGRDVRRIAFLLACYDRCIRSRSDDRGQPYPLDEPNAMDTVQSVIERDTPRALLECSELVSSRAAADTRFVDQYLACTSLLAMHGTRATLERLDTLP